MNHTAPVRPLRETIPHRDAMLPVSIHRTMHTGFFDRSASETEYLYCHWHPESELFHLLEGRGIFAVGNQEYFIEAGDFIFLLPRDIHRFYAAEPASSISFEALVFDPTVLSASPADPLYDTGVKRVQEKYQL